VAIGLAVVTALGLTALAGRIYAYSVLRIGRRVSFRGALRGGKAPCPGPDRGLSATPRTPGAVYVGRSIFADRRMRNGAVMARATKIAASPRYSESSNGPTARTTWS
jgi:hypothetical protein